MTQRFDISDFKKCHDIENRVMGPSRLLKMSPFDRALMTSYRRYILTMTLSRIVSEIFNVEWKKRSEETQTLRAGCSKAEPKNLAPPQTPFPGRGTAKI